ncbi:MAG TPA: hypothetical protein VK427_15975 [Kofleriaceae bacterium]|nr:hypothetical protein [Kofleriaceae bacterium]
MVRPLLALLWFATPASAQRDVGWEVRVPEKVELVVGEAATLPIAIAVDRGLAISKEALVILDVMATGVTTRKPRLGRADAVDPEADAPRFAVPLKAPTVGEHVVKIRLRMWLCGTRSCRPLDVRRQATIVVSAPKPVAP